jgi:hypothetical protein
MSRFCAGFMAVAVIYNCREEFCGYSPGSSGILDADLWRFKIKVIVLQRVLLQIILRDSGLVEAVLGGPHGAHLST